MSCSLCLCVVLLFVCLWARMKTLKITYVNVNDDIASSAKHHHRFRLMQALLAVVVGDVTKQNLHQNSFIHSISMRIPIGISLFLLYSFFFECLWYSEWSVCLLDGLENDGGWWLMGWIKWSVALRFDQTQGWSECFESVSAHSWQFFFWERSLQPLNL